MTLRELAEAWRVKAARLRDKYGIHREDAKAAIAALETCAEELEESIKSERVEPVNPS